MYHCGMNPTGELHAESFQMLRNKNSSPGRHNKSITSTNKARSKQYFHLNSQLYYEIFFITSIHAQLWLHLTRVIQDMLHICVLSERKQMRSRPRLQQRPGDDS